MRRLVTSVTIMVGVLALVASAYAATTAVSSHPTGVVTAGGGGTGNVVFDGTFSPTDPASGPHWNNAYGSCYQYNASDQLTIYVSTSCDPGHNGHYRTDICTGGPSGCSATQGVVPYHKGTAYCTSIPFEIPKTLPTGNGNSWFQITEMKDSSSKGGDWTIGIGSHGKTLLAFGFTGGAYNNTDAYNGPEPTTGVWHTASVCQDAGGTSAKAYYDGSPITYDIGPCAGQTICTGLNMYYDGFVNQPLDINAYTGNTSGTDPYVGYSVVHGDPLIVTGTTPPMPPGGWNSP